MTDDNKCTCPDCRGDCHNRRGLEKCSKCGAMKFKFRRCHKCEKPLVYTAKRKPRVIPMYGDDK